MSVIRTNAAAALLGVSANTLRSWEGRFGYPTPRRSEGGHRQYELAEIEALRQAYAQTGDIASAISIARARGEGVATDTRLREALVRFDSEQADRLVEESLALRSVERTVQTVLLPAVQGLAGNGEERHTDAQGSNAQAGAPEYCFGWRYASGWLAAAQRVAPPATREHGVLIFDASRALEMDALHVQAFELLLRRAGVRVLALPVELDSARVGNALRALQPDAVVLAGSGATLDTIGRLMYATRRGAGDLPVMDFRGAVPDTGASTVQRIGPDAGDAAQALLDSLMQPRASERAKLARVS